MILSLRLLRMTRNKGLQGSPLRLIRRQPEKQPPMGQSGKRHGLGPVVLLCLIVGTDGETRPASDTGRDVLPLCN